MSKLIRIVVFIVFIIIVLLPPILNEYIYVGDGDDSSLHLTNIKSSDLFNQLYLGYAVIGYPVKFISNAFQLDLNMVYMWTCYILLICVGLSFYYVLSRLVNWQAGLLGMYIPFFITLGLWWQFDYGMVFNYVNVGIILPFLIYHSVKYISTPTLKRCLVVIGISIIFGLFHSTSIYILPTVVLLIVIYYIKHKLKHQKVDHRLMMTGIVVVTFNIICLGILYAQTQKILPEAIFEAFSGIRMCPPFYYVGCVSLFTLGILAYSLYSYKGIKGKTDQVSKLLIILSVLAMVLFISTLGISESPDRQIMDMGTILALIACVLGGLIIQHDKIGRVIIISLVSIGFIVNLGGWFEYRNSVNPIDKEVFSYMNQLECDTYSCSSSIAPLIYNQYIKQSYVDNDADIIIMRSEPMTAASNKDSIAFKNKAFLPHYDPDLTSYKLVMSYNDDIRIDVYGRTDEN